MARRPNARRRLEALADQFEPIIRASFLAAIADLASNAEIGRIIERLERGDINGALRALHVDPAAFRQFEEEIRRAYLAGGNAAADSLPQLRTPDGGRVVWRFDARFPVAENYLRDFSGRRITRMTEDMMLASRNVLAEGLAEGINPKRLTSRLVGVYDRQRRERFGGILGLTSTQERAVSRARRSILAGDRAFIAEYLNRDARDRGPFGIFDKRLREVMRGERALSVAEVDQMMRGYESSLLRVRADTISRTEMLGALNHSNYAATEQMIAAGNINRQDVKKRWKATKDSRVRDSHSALDGETVGIDERFSNGLLYPCEPGGAPEETINCRCSYDVVVDHLAGLE